MLIDHTGKQLADSITEDTITRTQARINAAIRSKVLQMHSGTLRKMLKNCDSLANKAAPAIVEKAKQAATLDLNREIDRLQALRTINPNIREDEVDYFRNELDNIVGRLDETLPQLDAVRVMVVV